MLPVVVAQSSFDNSSICYILLGLWMTSFFHIMEPIGENQRQCYASSSSADGSTSKISDNIMFDQVCQIVAPRANLLSTILGLSACVIWSCYLVLTTLYISGFVDDVIFLHNGANGAESRMMPTFSWVHQVAAPGAQLLGRSCCLWLQACYYYKKLFLLFSLTGALFYMQIHFVSSKWLCWYTEGLCFCNFIAKLILFNAAVLIHLSFDNIVALGGKYRRKILFCAKRNVSYSNS